MSLFREFRGALVYREMALNATMCSFDEHLVPAGRWVYVAYFDGGESFVHCPQHWSDVYGDVPAGQHLALCPTCGRDELEADVGDPSPGECLRCFERRLTAQLQVELALVGAA